MFRPLLVVTAILALTTTGCEGSDANKLGVTTRTKAKGLSMAIATGPSLAMDQFGRAVERASEGRLRIQYRNEWRRGEADAELDLVRDVAHGNVDLGSVASRAMSPLGMPEFDALQAPMLIDSYELEDHVLGSDVVRDMTGEMKSLGVEPVGVLPGQMQYLLTTMPVDEPADLSGRVIGYSGYEQAARTLKALGARPRAMPAARPDYDGLDGVLANTDSLTGSGFHRHARHLAANVGFWPRPLLIFASPQVDSDDLEVLRRAAIAAFPQVLAGEEEREREQTQEMCRAGVQPHQLDVGAMKRAVRPAYERLESDPATSRVIQSIQAIASRVEVPRASLGCAPASRAAETIPVGTYEVTITRADARAAGLEEDYSEGSKRFTLQIRPDEFILRNASEAEIGIQGTYSVFRERFVANGTNGDKLTARWSAENDELRFMDMTLHPRVGPPETDSPYNLTWTTHPWQRVR